MKKIMLNGAFTLGAFASVCLLASCGAEKGVKYSSIKYEITGENAQEIGDYKELSFVTPIKPTYNMAGATKLTGKTACDGKRSEKRANTWENLDELYTDFYQLGKTVQTEYVYIDSVGKQKITSIIDYSTGNRYDSIVYFGNPYSLSLEAYSFYDEESGYTEYIKADVNYACDAVIESIYNEALDSYTNITLSETYYSGTVYIKNTGSISPRMQEGYIYDGYVTIPTPRIYYSMGLNENASQTMEIKGKTIHDSIGLNGEAIEVFVNDGLVEYAGYSSENLQVSYAYTYDAKLPKCSFMNSTFLEENESDTLYPIPQRRMELIESAKRWIIAANQE